MPDTASEAAGYLDSALDLMQTHALTRAGLDWPAIRAQARARCAHATGPEGTYDAIRWTLAALGDGHSFFSAPATGSRAIAEGLYRDEVSAPSSRLVAPGVRLVEVPSFRGTPHDALGYAVSLHEALSVGLDAATRGWIIDVSNNTGGNMLPMLAGLGPLIGEGELGAFRFPGRARTPWIYEGGELWIGAERVMRVPAATDSTRLSRAPVAIIQGPRTASSGEAVVMAFHGRPDAMTFGLRTAGLTTSNDQFELPDGASIAIAVAWFEDRAGGIPRGPLQPDVVVSSPGSAPDDAALDWLISEFTDR